MKIFFKKQKEKSTDDVLKDAKKWIVNNTVDNNGIVVSTQDKKLIYPEVTGYYIPTLLKYNDIERAKNYANYLISIQNEDG